MGMMFYSELPRFHKNNVDPILPVIEVAEIQWKKPIHDIGPGKPSLYYVAGVVEHEDGEYLLFSNQRSDDDFLINWMKEPKTNIASYQTIDRIVRSKTE